MNQKLRWALTGAVGLLFVGAGLLLLTMQTSAGGLSTQAEPTKLEAWAATRARDMAMPADAKAKRNPIPNSAEAMAEAKEHWADHCAGCHANDGSGDNTMGKKMYPPAPDMRKEQTQRLTDGELFYIIENGIRLTGMPAWSTGTEHGAEATWKLVHFIRHLPSLSPAEISAMEKMNPKSPADLEEEKQEEEFLKGGSPAPVSEHHH